MDLKLIAALSNPQYRYEASIKIAEYFNCKYLIILIKDPEIDLLLPAPGFPETLPGSPGWDIFSGLCLRLGFHTGELPFLDDPSLTASGFAGPEDSVAILLGGRVTMDDILPLKDIMPLLIELFRKEQSCLISETRVKLSEKSAAKADQLVKTIDLMRIHLKNALINQEKDKKEIQELMRKKDEFLNVASHELKTPVTTIKAYIQLLNKKLPPGDESAIFLGRAEKQVRKLTELIEDLLDVSKIQSGQMVYHQEAIELSEIIDEVISQTQVSTSSHQIIVEKMERARVFVDRNRLEQVLSNILSNAIKYSPKAEKVVIKTQIHCDFIHIYIRDFGVGISADKHQFIFNRFFRVQETANNFPGLGLGLFISSQIIQRHGGEIKLNSRSDGTEFVVSLPLIK